MFRELSRRARILVERDGVPYTYSEDASLRDGRLLHLKGLVVEVEANGDLEIYLPDVSVSIFAEQLTGEVGYGGPSHLIKQAIDILKPLMVLEDIADV